MNPFDDHEIISGALRTSLSVTIEYDAVPQRIIKQSSGPKIMVHLSGFHNALCWEKAFLPSFFHSLLSGCLVRIYYVPGSVL